ncbi:putative membrane protein YdjX (TVP38/TMEM64 family) [Paenibacillus mucilaginosus]|uniref:TVP38/TMEM64 family protein n=1 Tax=Paenibacillus mucilaginosus TaxID=61624 RepID=UPI003D1CE542
MSWNETLSRMNWHQVEHWLKQYEALGPLPGIVAPMVESYIPVLPLVAILVANVNAYGLTEGFLLSWIGVVLGSISVFAIVRRFSGRIRGWIERKHPRSQRLIHWLETHGFTPIFVLACFPFTPSSLVNIVSGLSRVPFHTFAVATTLGKGVMIFLVSFAGHDIRSLLSQPWKIALVLGVFALMWLMGRKLESKYFK